MTTTFTSSTPIIEPNQEAWDEPAPMETPHQHENPFLSTPDSDSDFLPTPLSNSSSSTDDLYSVHFRISELFRSAFANRLHNYIDVDALYPDSDPDSLAIVPVPEEQPEPESEPNPERALSVVVARRKPIGRSNELVRVSNLGIEEQRNFRDVVRRTRIMYDSLRILANFEEEQRLRRQGQGQGQGRRARADLRAAQVMREGGLWLNRDKRIVGPIPGIVIGDVFFYRMELCVIGLHGQVQAGIDYLAESQSSNGEPIATSIVISGG